MNWALAAFALILIAYVCRRILRLDAEPARSRGFVPLSPARERIYEPIALEIETQTAILGISLDEALGEHDSGSQENAWRLMRLAVCQWDRLAEIAIIILDPMTEHLPAMRSVALTRTMPSMRFKSRTMVEFVSMPEMLNQHVFRSITRFHLHVRVLRRALETLTAEFRRSYRTADRIKGSADAMWASLDPFFHDFDLIIKETLLVLRAFLIALPEENLSDFSSDFKNVVTHGVRSKSTGAPRQVGF